MENEYKNKCENVIETMNPVKHAGESRDRDQETTWKLLLQSQASAWFLQGKKRIKQGMVLISPVYNYNEAVLLVDEDPLEA